MNEATTTPEQKLRHTLERNAQWLGREDALATFAALLGTTSEQLVLDAVRNEADRLIGCGLTEQEAWGSTLLNLATWGMGFLPHALVFNSPERRDEINAALLGSYRKITLQDAGRLG